MPAAGTASSEPLFHLVCTLPLAGRAELVCTDRGLRYLFLAEDPHCRPMTFAPQCPPLLHEARRQLEAYFTGRLRSFDLPLDVQGTAFQQAIWQALRAIPFGKLKSYGELAAAAGSPRACRAAGSACGANTLPVIIPCHRAIAAGQKLGGFGLGLDLKRKLLTLEGHRF